MGQAANLIAIIAGILAILQGAVWIITSVRNWKKTQSVESDASFPQNTQSAVTSNAVVSGEIRPRTGWRRLAHYLRYGLLLLFTIFIGAWAMSSALIFILYPFRESLPHDIYESHAKWEVIPFSIVIVLGVIAFVTPNKGRMHVGAKIIAIILGLVFCGIVIDDASSPLFSEQNVSIQIPR